MLCNPDEVLSTAASRLTGRQSPHEVALDSAKACIPLCQMFAASFLHVSQEPKHVRLDVACVRFWRGAESGGLQTSWNDGGGWIDGWGAPSVTA